MNLAKHPEVDKWIRTHDYCQAESVLRIVSALSGISEDTLERARILKGSDSSPLEVLRAANTIDDVFNAVKTLNVEDIAKRNANAKLSEKRLKKYSLIPLATGNKYLEGHERTYCPSGDGPDEVYYHIYLDGPIGVALAFEGAPAATLGLNPVEEQLLLITQLQGVKPKYREGRVGKSRGLAPLQWKEVMVDIATSIAERLGISYVGIQSANNNLWISSDHLPSSKGILIYDAFAQSLGMTQDIRENWYASTENVRVALNKQLQ